MEKHQNVPFPPRMMTPENREQLFSELNIQPKGDGLLDLFNLFNIECPYGHALTIGGILYIESQYNTELTYEECLWCVKVTYKGETHARYFQEWEKTPKEYVESLRAYKTISF